MSDPCPHAVIDFRMDLRAFQDRPGRLLELAGICKGCGLPVRFVGAPVGFSVNRPSQTIEGDIIALPFVIGDDIHVPGPEAMVKAPDDSSAESAEQQEAKPCA